MSAASRVSRSAPAAISSSYATEKSPLTAQRPPGNGGASLSVRIQTEDHHTDTTPAAAREGGTSSTQQGWLTRLLSGYKYGSTSSHPSSNNTGSKSTGQLRSIAEEEVMEEEEGDASDDDQDLEQGSPLSGAGCCGWWRKCPGRFKATQRHRRCPHTFHICLVFFMFVLLGVVERGGLSVLLYLLRHHFLLDSGEAITLYFFVRFFIYVMYPVMGWLADTAYGHYKVIRLCLCVTWLGAAFMAISFASYYSLHPRPEPPEPHALKPWLLPSWIFVAIGYTIYGAGLTGVRVNLIPFGADQLPDASAGELSSYFHWYYFCITLGHFSTVMLFPLILSLTNSFAFAFLALTMAISLLLVIFLSFHWTVVPKCGNPLRLVSEVVRAAYDSRQRPVRRSAFDVGMPKPSRLDKAMIKYGGRHTLEEVEDVKTFFRILMIVMSCVGYYTVFSQLQSTAVVQSYKMSLFSWNNCSQRALAHLQHVAGKINFTCQESPATPTNVEFAAASLLPLLLLMPLYDRLIYSCLSGWKWFSMLSRMALGNFFIVASVVSAAGVEGARMHQLASVLRGNHTPVVINAQRFHPGTDAFDVASPLPELYILIPFTFFVFAELFSNVTAVEFIYAQSPGNMKGLLIGMLFASEGIAMALSGLITLVFSLAPPADSFFAFFANNRYFFTEVLNPKSSCRRALESSLFGCTDGILFVYLLLVLVAVVSAIFFGVAAVVYKRRRRDQDPYMLIWPIPEDKRSTFQRLIRKCCC